eukprot:TRINITY_DN19055_c0_g1::TRINITY_DN19055_c0_g1_i1::g.13893::m.13893 TRINITY_DN19055_c0_g1::TRINITY_DN19055_c0_g1_i1::g.13893  ORF type:complete len:331 (+),score=61.86,sp/Q9M9S6/UTR3_ARATH/37.10/5e-49,UAA/PF08449.6/3.8e-73,EamA/PF00892.15/0.71,EamA/PF00892.15/6.9e-07,DUF914/PF06027.7/3.2e-06,TPT/PF03151.11/93,TPT/PF03151.11/4.4e-06,EmrE/PF13536.1/1.1,EmrE/PF13536.1/1.9e+02,EmrE/PF13536.1/0.0041,Nuc_sug_transp/PF04142.10/0.067,Nuc_sug_transp/PF04142.10/3.2,Cation_efflux/PF01545.16/1.3e+02,Cation_ef
MYSKTRVLELLFYACGIYISYIIWGFLQEKLTTTPYGEEKEYFEHIAFLNFVQYSSSAVFSGCVLFLLRDQVKQLKTPSPPAFPFMVLGLTVAGGSALGYASLQHINFPLHMLAKSSKLVPVLMWGRIMGHRYHWKQYASVGLITIGVGIFSSGAHKHVQGESESEATLIGLALVLANLVLDGFTNAQQDKLNRAMGLSAHQMMYYVNLYCSVVVGLWMVLSPLFELGPGFGPAIAFCMKHPQALKEVLTFAACGCLGQNFIFASLKTFGSLTNVTITITRKFFTILISVLFFGHHTTPLQWFACSLVFIGCFLSSTAKDEAVHLKKKSN